MNYIDLGLPSGTLWADTNEEGYFIFDVAKEKFGDSVPTIDEWRELIDNCEWLWDFNNKQMVIIGKNDNRITLPAAGWRDTSMYDMGSRGYYWSSSLSPDYPSYVCSVYFNSDNVSCCNIILRYYGRSVRLVKRK